MAQATKRRFTWMHWCLALVLVAVVVVVFFGWRTVDRLLQFSGKQYTRDVSYSQIYEAILLYVADNDDRLPIEFKTNDDLRALFIDDETADMWLRVYHKESSTIVPNPNLAGLALGSIASPDRTVLIYETIPWKDGSLTYGFVDGSFKEVTDTSLVIIKPMIISFDDAE